MTFMRHYQHLTRERAGVDMGQRRVRTSFENERCGCAARRDHLYDSMETRMPRKTATDKRDHHNKRHEVEAANRGTDLPVVGEPGAKLSAKAYAREMKALHVELVKLQQWVVKKGLKVCIVFEGRDGAGKGGTIKAITERVSPRVFRVVALPAPSEREKTQMYSQRYLPHLPAAGEVVIFDRSWYNRAGVERVMGFCTDAEYREFLRQVPEFERMLVRQGIHVFKFWFSVSRREQRRRFKEREVHPLKHWKLSPIDLASLDKWEEYTRSKEAMFFHTDTADAPWIVIKSDCKKRARLNALRYLLHKLPYSTKDADQIGPVDALLVGRAQVVFERGEHVATAPMT